MKRPNEGLAVHLDKQCCNLGPGGRGGGRSGPRYDPCCRNNGKLTSVHFASFNNCRTNFILINHHYTHHGSICFRFYHLKPVQRVQKTFLYRMAAGGLIESEPLHIYIPSNCTRNIPLQTGTVRL